MLGFLRFTRRARQHSAEDPGILEKIRAPIDKAINFVIGLAVKLAKAAGKLFTGAFGKKKEEDPNKKGPHEDEPEKAAQIQAGLAFLNQDAAARADNGSITREDCGEGSRRHQAAASGLQDSDGDRRR